MDETGDDGAGVIGQGRRQLIKLADAAKLIPSPFEGQPHISVATLTRWVKHGSRVGRQLVKLRAVKPGKCYLTSVAWVEEFLLAASGLPTTGELPSMISSAGDPPVTRRTLDAESRRASAILDAAGIGTPSTRQPRRK